MFYIHTWRHTTSKENTYICMYVFDIRQGVGKRSCRGTKMTRPRKGALKSPQE